MILPVPLPEILFLIQYTATALMTGILWFVQIVHYPLFARVPADGFTHYEQSHTARTGWVVAPLMIFELVTAAALPLFRMEIATTHTYFAALGCLFLIWASTFLIQVPLHGILSKYPDTKAMKRLVSTNWIRTILWTIRLGLMGTLVFRGGGN